MKVISQRGTYMELNVDSNTMGCDGIIALYFSKLLPAKVLYAGT